MGMMLLDQQEHDFGVIGSVIPEDDLTNRTIG
jgi:hypothetical protein